MHMAWTFVVVVAIQLNYPHNRGTHSNALCSPLGSQTEEQGTLPPWPIDRYRGFSRPVQGLVLQGL